MYRSERGRVSKEDYNSINDELEETTTYIDKGIYIDPDNIVNNILPNYDLLEMSKQENSVGIVAKMILSVDKGTFKEEYKDMFEDIKASTKEHVKEIIKIDDFNFESDEELLIRIKNNLINILNEKERK